MGEHRGIPDSTALAHAQREAAAGERLYRQSRFHEALPHYREAVRLWPAQPDLHYMLASAAWRAEELALVERHYLQALRLDPRHAYAHEGLSHWYRSLRQLDLAVRHVETALALQPGNPDFIVSRAEVLADAGDPATAWGLIESVLADPQLADRAAIVYLRIAPKIGREAEAAQWVAELIARPGQPSLHRPQLLFAAAALLDRIGQYDQAFEYARQAHVVFPREHDAAEFSGRVDRQIEFSTRQRLQSLPHAAHHDERPVFILGMPRSGTSLVEQILASHPQVFGAGELDPFPRIAASLQPGEASYPRCLEALSETQVDQISGAHLSALQSLDPAAQYVTDKTPYNFLYLDLIELLFPQARVIHCLRSPLDTCLSCYMTDFTIGNAFAWTLRDLGRYYRGYRRIMDHWKQALDLRVLEVRYEGVVGDIAGQTRRMLAFLELPWDDRCLRFHESRRPVLTASREQVRQPLYSSSIGRWKHYENHLRELIAALGDAIK